MRPPRTILSFNLHQKPLVHLWLHGSWLADGPLVDLGRCLHWQGDDGWWWWMWILWNLFWMLSFGFTTALSFAHNDVDGDSEHHNYNFPILLRVWIFMFSSLTHYYNVSVLLWVWHGQLKGGPGWRQEDVKMSNNKNYVHILCILCAAYCVLALHLLSLLLGML